MIYTFCKESLKPEKLSEEYRLVDKNSHQDFLKILKKTDHPSPKERLDQIYNIGHTFWTACFYKNVMLGFACFLLINSQEIKLEQLAVLPQVQGRGIGRSLMRSYSLFLKSVPKKYLLDVRSENEYAMSFYQKQGFVVVAER